jgi:hypothetical protein
VTAPYTEIYPQAILIPQRLAMELDVSLWHVIDVSRAFTWCGLTLDARFGSTLMERDPPGSPLSDLHGSISR